MDAHKNFAYSLVATAPSPANSGTSLVVTAGTGGKFPVAPFNAVVWQTGVLATTANSEIVRVTAVSTDTLTIERNTNTEPNNQVRSIVIGDQISAAVTGKTLSDVETPLATAQADIATLQSNVASLYNPWSHDFSAFDDTIADWSVAHGLGRLPVWVRLVLVCDSADIFNAGDEIEWDTLWTQEWGSFFTIRSTSTDILITTLNPLVGNEVNCRCWDPSQAVGARQSNLTDASKYHLKVYAF